MALAAAGQICSTASISHNLSQCRQVIKKPSLQGPRQFFSLKPLTILSLFVLGLQEDAKKHSLPISVGVHEPSDDPASKRIMNTLIWINEKGEIEHRYQKIHLFDLEKRGGPIMKESNITEPGNMILPPFVSTLGKKESMICFDLRFPEIALALKRQKADVLLYPSAFTAPTGKAHWLPLLRARAIECQAYVIAAAQAGAHSEKRTSYGHSIIIDSWGEFIAELEGENKEGPEVIFAEIDLAKLVKVRGRCDVYPEV